MNHHNNKIFKSPEGKEQFLTYYNQILSHLPGYGHVIGDAGDIIAPFLEKENNR
jgi:hypothetical protein